MSNDLLNTDGSITNYWWDCPSCGKTKISSVLHDEEGNIKGVTMCCPECFYVLKGEEKTYVDETVYEIPSEWIPLLEQPRWKCQQCGALNEKPSEQELKNLTIDDLYCQSCQTWQCDIVGAPEVQTEETLTRYKKVEAKSRWENPILPIEFSQEEKDQSPKTSSHNEPVQLSNKSPHFSSFWLKIISLIIILLAGLWIYDGLKLRTVNGFIANPRATVSVNISKYTIVKKEGWNPNLSVPDYKLINQFAKQNGTKRVPDGVEKYFETEKYIARYETTTYTDTITERVKTGTKTIKGQCKTVTSGAVAKTKCEPDRIEDVYSNKTKQVTKTKEIPVYDTRKVEKTRQKYRTEPVYRTWYVWQEGEWLKTQTLTAESNAFALKYPDTSKFANKPNFRVENPQQSCHVAIQAETQKLSVSDFEIDCNLYKKLSANNSATFLYRKWKGIEDIKLL